MSATSGSSANRTAIHGKMCQSTLENPSECEICLCTLDHTTSYYSLACDHKYCADCTGRYIKLGAPSKRLTFNHLFCPMRCGTGFCDVVSIAENKELSTIISEQLHLYSEVQKLVLGWLTSEGESCDPCNDANISRTMEILPCYQCNQCHDVYTNGKEQCCAAAEDPSRSLLEDYCLSCRHHVSTTDSMIKFTKTAPRNQSRLSVFKTLNRITSKPTEISDDEATRCPNQFICTSDANAIAQANELEVLLAIFPDNLIILVDPPERQGSPAAKFIVTAPSTCSMQSPSLHVLVHGKFDGTIGSDSGSDYEDDEEYETVNKTGDSSSGHNNEIDAIELATRIESTLQSQAKHLSLHFMMPGDYPETASPRVTLKTGDLSMFEFDFTMRNILLGDLERVTSQHMGSVCVFECIQVLVDWFEFKLQEIIRRRAQEEFDQQQLWRRRAVDLNRIVFINKALKGDRSLKGNIRQCRRCQYGPITVDNECSDLAAYHGIRLGRSRIDNSCPQCGYFATKTHGWPLWNGIFPWQIVVPSVQKSEEDQRKDREKEERMNTLCFIASIRAHAKQCPKCDFGPIMKDYCDNLATHHNEQRGSQTINNSCPRCGFFANHWSEYKSWDGRLWLIEGSDKK